MPPKDKSIKQTLHIDNINQGMKTRSTSPSRCDTDANIFHDNQSYMTLVDKNTEGHSSSQDPCRSNNDGIGSENKTDKNDNLVM